MVFCDYSVDSVDNFLEGENGMEENRIFACSEHLEYLLDDLLEETQTAPSLEKIPNEKQIEQTCSWCNLPAEYRLVFEYGMTQGE